MRVLSLLVLVACGRGTIHPGPSEPLSAHALATIDTSHKARRRMVPPEAYLRAYLTWFGGLAPLEVQKRARGKEMFDAWVDYFAAIGLPDHRLDLPRASQSNTLMRATLGRLAEALCVRAAEHDLLGNADVGSRVIFKFELVPGPTETEFGVGFDVLHRTFLSYPASLAGPARMHAFFGLYQNIASRHVRKKPLDADQTAWAAVCTALVQHPEAELY